jgi:uncharacterized spore protein YtfJ
MNIATLTETVMSEMRETARTRTVTGAPIRSGKTTMVPVSRVSFGFGAYGGGAETKHRRSAGAGAGATIEPVAFVAIGKRKARLLPIRKREAAPVRLFEIVPAVLRLILHAVRCGKNRQRVRRAMSKRV